MSDLIFVGDVHGSVGQQSLLFFVVFEFPRNGLVAEHVRFPDVEGDAHVVSRFIESIVDELRNGLLLKLFQVVLDFFTERVSLLLFSHSLLIIRDVEIRPILLGLLGDCQGLGEPISDMLDEVSAITDQHTLKSVN